jgi:hypothetical protein
MSQRKKNKGTKARRQKSKRWVTALRAGEKTLKTTGSLKKARETLRSQALLNARKLFGSIGRTL